MLANPEIITLFLCVCVGVPGAPGRDGSDGRPGDPGADGEDGVPGDDGKSLMWGILFSAQANNDQLTLFIL